MMGYGAFLIRKHLEIAEARFYTCHIIIIIIAAFIERHGVRMSADTEVLVEVG